MTTDPKPPSAPSDTDSEKVSAQFEFGASVPQLERVYAESGRDGISAYLRDTLGTAGTEMPPEERLIVFEFLSQAQAAKLDTDLIAQSKTMFEEFVELGAEFSPKLTGDYQTAKAVLDRLQRTYNQEVERTGRDGDHEMAKGGLERLLRTEEHLNEAVRYISTFSDWAHSAQPIARSLLEGQVVSKRHKDAMTIARQTLVEDYDGKPKDLSLAIDNDVVESVTSKIVEALSKTDSPATAIAEVLGGLGKEVSPAKKDGLQRLVKAMEALYADLRAKSQTLEPDIMQAIRAIRRDLPRQLDDLRMVSSKEDIVGVAKRFSVVFDQSFAMAQKAVTDANRFFVETESQIVSLQHQR